MYAVLGFPSETMVVYFVWGGSAGSFFSVAFIGGLEIGGTDVLTCRMP